MSDAEPNPGALIDRLLGLAVTRGASDLHVASGLPPILRVDGALQRADEPPLSARIVGALVALIATRDRDRGNAATATATLDDGELDLAFTHNEIRCRVNAFMTLAGPALALRMIRANAPSLAALGAPDALAALAVRSQGLVLVTGPTGSGKSTTLAAMIREINTTLARHIVTIEDPIEYVHQSGRSLVSQRQVGLHTPSFRDALRAALREDPDVVLVGEMRDLETISLALTAAETGHLVLATLHTSSAAKAVNRIIDVFPTGDKDMVRTMIAGSIEGVVAQTLLPKFGGGRVGAFEVLIATPAVRNLIREGKVAQLESMIQLGARYGMQSMRDAVDALVATGTVAASAAAPTLALIGAEEKAPTAHTTGARPDPPASALPQATEPPPASRTAKTGFTF